MSVQIFVCTGRWSMGRHCRSLFSLLFSRLVFRNVPIVLQKTNLQHRLSAKNLRWNIQDHRRTIPPTR